MSGRQQDGAVKVIMAKFSEPAERSDLQAFRLSRIYAEGWNAARICATPSSCPYGSEPEQSRWLEGYAGARV